MNKLIKQNSLVMYLILVYAITWALWVPATVTKLNGGISIFGPDHTIGQFGRWAPGIVAILLTLILGGKQGVKTLFRPLGVWRVNIGWYGIALFLQPLIFFTARWMDGLLGNSYQIVMPLDSIGYPLAFVVPVAVITAFPGAFAEELGWRGYALPGLQNKVSALIASVILAFAWGIWHIPSMLYSEQTQVWGLVIAVLNFIPVTILFTWMYNNTKGSLLLVTLLHVAQQLTSYLLGLIPSATDEILMWLVASAVVFFYGRQLRKE
jgi:hypothetical protein